MFIVSLEEITGDHVGIDFDRSGGIADRGLGVKLRSSPVRWNFFSPQFWRIDLRRVGQCMRKEEWVLTRHGTSHAFSTAYPFFMGMNGTSCPYFSSVLLPFFSLVSMAVQCAIHNCYSQILLYLNQTTEPFP